MKRRTTLPLAALLVTLIVVPGRASGQVPAPAEAPLVLRFAAFTGLLMALIWAPLGVWLGRER
jgi:hypothetical protein